MQYPIIDSLAKAYIKNGWSGFDFNLLPNDKSLWGPFGVYEHGYADSSTRFAPAYYNFPLLKPGKQYIIDSTLSSDYTIDVGINIYLNDNRIYDSGWHELPFIFTVPNINFDTIRTPFRYRDNRNVLSTVEEIGTTVFMSFNEYPLIDGINYTLYTDDISPRLKLPLPHYFPHPVIDALKRAETGSQTTEDTEILKHYLTPLGIGGI